MKELTDISDRVSYKDNVFFYNFYVHCWFFSFYLLGLSNFRYEALKTGTFLM